ncbi:hypothetical protein JCM8547_004320 [Rhodosporidiobolus lusitaniae]
MAKKKTSNERVYCAKHLVVDSAPLFEAPLSALRGMAANHFVTSDVVAEMTDRRHRNLLAEAKLHLPADSLQPGEQPSELTKTVDGFIVREPTAESVAKITAFARKTGDIAVLSTADIRVLALCLTLELEENGSWRIREYPGQVLSGPPKEEKKEGEEEKKDEAGEKVKDAVKEGEEAEELADSVEKLNVVEESTKDEALPVVEESPVASTSSLPPPVPSAAADPPSTSTDSPAPSSSVSAPAASSSSLSPPSAAPEPEASAAAEEDEDVSDAESDASGGSWITPENVVEHKVRDLGLFSAPDAEGEQPTASTSSVAAAPPTRPRTVMKSAVLTGDYAMQNVALQMGLNVLGSGGKRVKEVRTWVLRCHACFKLCKNPEKKFCPSCGGATLIRTSITYVTATPQNPLGYILHLKSNFNYKLRGTQYSLPNPKMGRAGGGANAEIITREDQKEWIRGVKSAEIKKEKEARALRKAVMDEERRTNGAAGSGNSMASGTSASWFAEAGSLEAQMMGIGGGKGGIENPKGRRRGGKNGAGGEVRLDKNGLPEIGHGRRNPNAVRKRKG